MLFLEDYVVGRPIDLGIYFIVVIFFTHQYLQRIERKKEKIVKSRNVSRESSRVVRSLTALLSEDGLIVVPGAVANFINT